MKYKSTKSERSSDILVYDGYNVPMQIGKSRIKYLAKLTQ